MTSRERVMRVVNYQTPDRVPIDLGGMRASGISAFALHNLLRHLGYKNERVMVDPGLVIGWVPEFVRERFHIDVISILPPPCANPDYEGWHDWRPRPEIDMLIPSNFNPVKAKDGGWEVIRDGKVVLKMPEGGYYFDGTGTALETDFSKLPEIPSVRNYNPGDLFTDEELKYYERRAKFLWENTKYAILFSSLGGMFDINIGGLVNWMCMIASEPELAREYVEKKCDLMIKKVSQLRDAAGGKVFAFETWGDMGTQKSEFYSLESFKKVFAPSYKRLCEWTHKNTDFKVFLHSCGSIHNYIETFIDCGIDILNPVQTSAENMSPHKLKKEFGGRIIFWGGGCNTQKILPFGTKEDVEKDVKSNMEIFAPGGGYVFNQIHNIQADTPPENIVAMLDAAYKYSVITQKT